MVQFQYSSEGQKDLSSFELIPEGYYRGMISASEIKPTKAGNGNFIEFKIVIDGGAYDSRNLFDYVNFDNVSEKAMEIGHKRLNSIIRAVAQHRNGSEIIHDTNDLHILPFLMYVGVKPAEGQYQPSNFIKNYLPLPHDFDYSKPYTPPPKDSTAPVAVGATNSSPQQPTAPVGAGVAPDGKPPWE